MLLPFQSHPDGTSSLSLPSTMTVLPLKGHSMQLGTSQQAAQELRGSQLEMMAKNLRKQSYKHEVFHCSQKCH